MIVGAHTLLYADDADAARLFFRDVLGFDAVDAGGGWLIFALPPAELGVHPVEGASGPSGRQELYLMCDDVVRTVEELKTKGVEFTAEISDEGWGVLTRFRLPGAGEAWLYEPRHASPLAGFSDA